MELTNEFTVAASVEEAWPLLTDIERIAPCVPGFQLKACTEDQYTGAMKVKVGAVQTNYDCVIRFVELDDAQHRAVISARGKDTRGQGGVTAEIISTLTPDGDQTHARVLTKLDVTGRVAQFGRGVLSDVSNRLVKQFVTQLQAQILAPEVQTANSSESASDGASTNGATADSASPDPEALDLLAVAGGPLIKRIAPVVAILALAALAVARMRSRAAR